jgi:hypothetical protein
MKKLLLSLLILICASGAFASQKFASVNNFANSVSCNVVIAPQEDRYIAINAVTARSDTANSYISIWIANTTGAVSTNTTYNEVIRYDLGVGTKDWHYTYPLAVFVASVNTAVRLSVSRSTTLNAINATYDLLY